MYLFVGGKPGLPISYPQWRNWSRTCKLVIAFGAAATGTAIKVESASAVRKIPHGLCMQTRLPHQVRIDAYSAIAVDLALVVAVKGRLRRLDHGHVSNPDAGA